MNKIIKYIGLKALGALVFVAVAGTSLWALAAFTEPTTTPGNSVQDFAKNIIGANNANNAFDSSNVTANSDGSIVERLESLENKVNNSYSACFNMYTETSNANAAPACPVGYASVGSGSYYNRYSGTNLYVTYSACCLAR